MDSTSWFNPITLVTIFVVSFHLCNSTDTISSTKFISDAKNESLLCSNGNFKLGFFTPLNSLNRYVGIWFHKVSEPTVVWVANRETPLNNGDGIFKITHDGNLAVFDKNSIIWSTNVSLMQNSQTTNSTAKLLSSGNLVLTNGLTVVWQSFDYPIDTFLPGMKFGLDRRTGLTRVWTSWKSKSDPARGEFYGLVDPRGSPQIFLYSRTLGGPYWRAGPYNGRALSGSAIVTNHADIFGFSFVNNSDEVYLTFTAPNSSIFIKSVLEPTGTFPAGVWLENNKVWASFNAPPNPCNTYMWCGPSSLCNSSNAVLCTCLTGFEPASNKDSNLTCLQKRRELHSCGLGPGEGFLRMSGLKVPDARVARVFPNVSLEECEKECLKSCNCTGYASSDINIGGRGCFAWYGELNDIRQYVDGQDFYLRVDAVELADMRKRPAGFRGTKKILVITAVLVLGVMFFCFYYSWRKHAKKKGQRAKQRYRDMILSDPTPTLSNNNKSSISKDRGECKNKELTFFDLDTVINATDNFSPAKKLGEGGFGPVYRGQLSNGQEIAVKRLSKNSGQGVIELRNEAMLIANLQHKNLVKLLGCCIESEEKMLIYEYMPNKSLEYIIFDETRKSLLDWKKRFEIILGVARGILYLHQDSRLTIIHRDLKASNILLDEDFNPKISDFGTARIFGVNQSRENTSRVVGTFGYMSPEYVLGGFFSAKSDIFSFGVLLLEIICGEKSIHYFSDDVNSNLITYAWDLWSKDRALEMIDKSIMGESSTTHEVLRCIQVGLLCVQDSATERPTMLSVFLMLSNEATPLPSPKQPMFAVFKSHTYSDYTTAQTQSFLNDVTVTMVD